MEDSTPSQQTAPTEEKDLMNIEVAFPPNFEIIKLALPEASKDHTYCYRDTIYNPSGKKLPIDIQYHEYIHMEQQQLMGDPDRWWYSYLTDTSFRLDQEIEAYGKQYAFCKEKIDGTNSFFKWMLENMAFALSGDAYGNLISYQKAEMAIKRYGKKEKN